MILPPPLPVVLLGKPTISHKSPLDPIQVSFDIAVPDKVNYLIEASSDLVTWTPIEARQDVHGTIFLNDSAGVERRFYRAKVKP